jgi:nitroreductase
MDLDKAIKERRSVKNFKKTKKVNYKDVLFALEAATKAPLAGNIFAVKFVLVSDKDKIKQLAEAAQQNFIADTDYVIVVCSDKKTLTRNYYERANMYARQQAGAAIENILLKLVDLGLSTCWIGAFSDETVKRVIRLPDDVDVEAMLPIGYELGKSKQKMKPNLDDSIFFDEWKNRFMKPRRMVESSNV